MCETPSTVVLPEGETLSAVERLLSAAGLAVRYYAEQGSDQVRVRYTGTQYALESSVSQRVSWGLVCSIAGRRSEFTLDQLWLLDGEVMTLADQLIDTHVQNASKRAKAAARG